MVLWVVLADINITRACLKNHSRNLHAPLCGIFCPNSVAVARYGAFIRTKSPTNCDVHLAESIFQTHSKLKSEVLLLQNTLLYYVQTIFCFFVRKILLFRISAFLNIQFCISCMLVNKCLSWRHIASHQDFRHAGSHTGILNFHPFHSPGFRI